MKRASLRRTWTLGLLLAAALGGAAAAQQMTAAVRVDQKPTVIDAAVALWNKGEYASALAEFEKSIAADADNLALHARFARTVVGARWKTTEVERERKRADTEKEKVAAAPKPAAGADAKAAGEKPAAAAAYKPPPVKTDAELEAMQKAADAANKALADTIALYERWMKERPTRPAYPYALALLTDSKNEATRGQLFLKAASLDPKLVEPYTELINMFSGFDDQAALKYAKKALDVKPDDVQARLTYARNLWAVDQAAGRRYYDGLLTQYAGAKDGATVIQQFISAVEDPAEKVPLVERFRREYPDQWTPGYYGNVDYFGAVVSDDPVKALALAKEIVEAMETPKPGGAAKPDPADTYMKSMWKENADYAQAVVDARGLIASGKGADALARLEKTKQPGSVDDEAQLEVLRAEATAAAGNVAKAYDMLVTTLAGDINDGAHAAALAVGAKLGKTPNQVDNEVWARRMEKAETFKDFDLATLDGKGRARLADLRGRVVLVDFWFPG